MSLVRIGKPWGRLHSDDEGAGCGDARTGSGARPRQREGPPSREATHSGARQCMEMRDRIGTSPHLGGISAQIAVDLIGDGLHSQQ